MTGPRAARPWWIAAGAVLVGALLLFTPLNERLSRPLTDWQLRQLAPGQAPAGVLVVDIDDASLAALKPQFGPWPFKRDVYALAIERLRALGARAIAFDLLLVDGQPGDEALARAIARPGAPVVLAAAGLRHAGDSGYSTRDAGAAVVPGDAPAYAWPTIAVPAPSVWPRADGPPPLGVITTPVDDDGVLRRVPLWHQAAGQRWPVLPYTVLTLLDGTAASRALPLDRSGALHLALGPTDAAPSVLPFAALMAPSGDGASAQVQGRVVFIGSSALLADAVMTVHGQVSGTAVLAQVYGALRDGAWVRPPTLWANALLVALAALPALWTLRRGRVAPPRDAALAGLALLVAAGLAGLWLVRLRLPTLWAAPLATAATGLALALALHFRHQAQAQQRLAHELAVAAEAARIKSEFLANVSHEIRTPLNALLGVAELLGESALTPTQQRQVRLFQEAGHTLHELINDLLDLSKIEAGRLELEREAFSLRRVLEGVVDLLRPHAERKGLLLAIELAADLPDGVHGDRRRLERAVTNLVGNAVKFTARGEVRLRARVDEAIADGISIEVSDSGIGIAPSKLDTIFEPFSQADGSVTRMYGGTGLGLAITRSVAELMGGSVAVRSTPGLGSVFTLRLPLPRAAVVPARPGAEVVGPLADGAPLQVLLAEDNEVNAYIFRAMLEGQPLTIDSAPNGPTALDLLKRRRYDIAFIDVQMPGMDGLSVTRELRQLEARSGRPRTPVVALTAGAFVADIQASAAAGCDRHLTKPVAKAQLLETLRQLATGQARESADPWLAGTQPMPFDAVSAIERLGGDDALYQRVLDHSRVFLEAWSRDFERARADGDADQARRLAHDLKAIAGALCADELHASAAALERALVGAADAAAIDRCAARLRDTLQPVVVALSRGRGRA